MTAPGRLRWYRYRLAAMSAAEILHRIRETLRRHYDRAYAGALIAAPRDYGALPQIPGLRAGLDAWNVPPELIAEWQASAHRAQSGTRQFFGHSWPVADRDSGWHLDPISMELWPRESFCFAIDYRHAGGRGDIKYVWELNRLQYLQPVAALAFKTKDAALARFCLSELESWIDANPPFKGVNWNSGIELALRVVSIVTVTSLIGEQATSDLRAKIWSTLHIHGRWIARYPSRFSSANNHRTAEGLGLLAIGILCPHFAEAAAWRESGWAILQDGAEKQILPDGAGAEQASGYLAALIETLLLGMKLAEGAALVIPDNYRRKLVEGAVYLRWLMDGTGGIPLIGDDDSACVFGDYRGDYAASIVGCVAALAQRNDLTVPAAAHLRQALFGFAPTADFAPYGTRCFTHGGITIGRHSSSQGDIVLAFDHGPLGYLSIAAHGHADALAVWLSIGGQPVLVDAGTYLYHAGPDERRHFRGTAAHNTMTVNGESSSQMAGGFNWSHKAQTRLRSFNSRGDFWQAEAEHDGHLESFHCLHRRALHVSPATGAVIEDSLIGGSTQTVEIAFLLHPALTARLEDKEIVICKGEQLMLRMRHDSGLQSAIGQAGTAAGGWYSPEFGVRLPATRISFSGTLEPEQKACTALYWSS